jgi:septum site-determining protein MinD
MATIASIHSFRGGTGKSNTAANVSAMLASLGQRVGVIDADIQSPGIHNLFGLGGDDVSASLNDFLWHGKPIAQIAHDVTEAVEAPVDGRIYLIPSSMQPGEITRVLREATTRSC